jgi:hypothetical protein
MVVSLEQSMPRSPAAAKTLADKLGDLLDRLIGGLAQPLRPAPVPVPVLVRRRAGTRSAERRG